MTHPTLSHRESVRKRIRSLAACSTVALGLSLVPGIAPPAFAAGVLVTSVGTLPATTAQTLPVAALFQPVTQPVGPGFQYLSVVVILSRGLTFANGSQRIEGQSILTLLGVPVTANGSGEAAIQVTALVNGASVTDQATAAVDVSTPTTTTPPVPTGPPVQVSMVMATGPASVKAGQTLLIGSLLKPVELGKQFETVGKTLIETTLTGGLVFEANGAQSTAATGPLADVLRNTLLISVRANSSGTVTLKFTARTTNLNLTDTATVTVTVPTAANASLPVPVPAGPVPAATSAPSATAAPTPVAAGNRPPTAVGKSAVVKANTATAVTLKGTDPEGAALVYSVVEFPEHGRLTGRAPNLTYVPEKGFVGTDAFTFTVSDRVSTSEEAVVSVTVISAKKAVVRKATVGKTTVRKTTKKTLNR